MSSEAPSRSISKGNFSCDNNTKSSFLSDTINTSKGSNSTDYAPKS